MEATVIMEKISKNTKLSKSNSDDTFRTNVPQFISQAFELGLEDKLSWRFGELDGKWVIIVEPIKKEE